MALYSMYNTPFKIQYHLLYLISNTGEYIEILPHCKMVDAWRRIAVPVDSLWLALRLALVLHSRTELYKRATTNLSQSESPDFSKTAFKYFICCGTLLQNIFQEHGTFWIYYIGFSSRYISILIIYLYCNLIDVHVL